MRTLINTNHIVKDKKGVTIDIAVKERRVNLW